MVTDNFRDLGTRVMAIVREALPAPSRKSAISAETDLARDLGLDSLATASLIFRLEQETGGDVTASPDIGERLGELRTVGDLIALANALSQKAARD